MVLPPTNKRHNIRSRDGEAAVGIIATTMIVETMTTMTTNLWQGCEVWASSLIPLSLVVVE